ncbi:hypothetical protein SUDANB145_04520 [Streptomyces sp. enrichment culture]|uniref:DUF397 domain-containing protein n=1 Tax=Streptomyces sp. enrichment culture TaxID=1795815 RepID=UPI003F54560E
MHPQSAQELTGAEWLKSSYSGGEQACLEAAANFPGAVPVRDSKAPDGPALVFRRASFAAFVAAVGAGVFGDV